MASACSTQRTCRSTKSFLTGQDAERWARSVEVELDRGIFVDTRKAQATTFGELIERYIHEVLPFKRGAKEDGIRLKSVLRHSICKHSMAVLDASKIAGYREARLKQVSSGTVIREHAYRLTTDAHFATVHIDEGVVVSGQRLLKTRALGHVHVQVNRLRDLAVHRSLHAMAGTGNDGDLHSFGSLQVGQLVVLEVAVLRRVHFFTAV